MYELLEEIRDFLIPKWQEENERNGISTNSYIAPSINMCRYSSVFLIKILTDLFPNENWEIQGGEPKYQYTWPDNINFEDPGPPDILCLEKGGYLPYPESNGYGHLWIKNNTNIIDITADQFRGKNIIITEIDDSRYIMNMPKEKLEKAMNFKIDIVDNWLNDYGFSSSKLSIK